MFLGVYHEKMTDWWIKKLDEYKHRSKLTDVAVAKRLDISAAMLAHARAGRRELPLQGKLRLLDALGYVITRDIFLRILSRDLRSALVDTNALLTESHLSGGESESDDGLDLPPVDNKI